MSTSGPTDAPTGEKPVPKDQDDAAVLSDDRMDAAPGGGGLMGPGAPDPLAGTAVGWTGAATPNSPIDAHLPPDGGVMKEHDARIRSLSDDTPTERGGA